MEQAKEPIQTRFTQLGNALDQTLNLSAPGVGAYARGYSQAYQQYWATGAGKSSFPTMKSSSPSSPRAESSTIAKAARNSSPKPTCVPAASGTSLLAKG